MGYDINQLRERAKNRQNAGVIAQANSHEQRLRFHTETVVSTTDYSFSVTEFLEWVKSLLPVDKYLTFVSLFRFPLPTSELLEQIYSELSKVWDGRNPFSDYQFTDSTYKDDWQYYRENVLKATDNWKTTGWNAFRTAINSVVICDLPDVQTSKYPEPYYYLLPITSVIDFDYDDESFEYIVFRQEHKKIAVFDNEYFRVFEEDQTGGLGAMLKEVRHEVGYTPAQWFWNIPISNERPYIKKSPVSNQLGALDWYLFKAISHRSLDMYAPYPVYWGYEQDCNYTNGETQDYCDGGFLRYSGGSYKILRDGSVEKCPVCNQKRLTGAGSFIEVPEPRKDVSMTPPAGVIPVDKNSLDYNVAEVDRLKQNIFTNIVGFGGYQQKEAVNELQVKSTYESRTTVLLDLKKAFEAIIQWTDQTICKLRYQQSFIGCTVNLGTEFYLYTIADLYAMYETAKKNGVSEAELDAIGDMIIESENRTNPRHRERMIILKHLEPLRHNTRAEVMGLIGKGIVNNSDIQVKLNFNNFVNRFERENTTVTEFGSLLPFDKKISIIYETLKSYAKISETGSAGD